MEQLNDEDFWSMVDKYERGRKTITNACKLVVNAYKSHQMTGSKFLTIAYADYSLLTEKPISRFAKRLIYRGLMKEEA